MLNSHDRPGELYVQMDWFQLRRFHLAELQSQSCSSYVWHGVWLVSPRTRSLFVQYHLSVARVRASNRSESIVTRRWISVGRQIPWILLVSWVLSASTLNILRGHAPALRGKSIHWRMTTYMGESWVLELDWVLFKSWYTRELFVSICDTRHSSDLNQLTYLYDLVSARVLHRVSGRVHESDYLIVWSYFLMRSL